MTPARLNGHQVAAIEATHYTVGQVATALGVTVGSVVRLHEAGTLPGVRRGGCLMWPRSLVDAFADDLRGLVMAP